MAVPTEQDVEKMFQQLGITLPSDNPMAPPVDPIDINIDIPATISVESTLKEITQLAGVLYAQLRRTPNNLMLVTKAIALLELKLKITGLNNLKPDTQHFIDNEINTYKRRFLEIVDKYIAEDRMKEMCEELSKEGL